MQSDDKVVIKQAVVKVDRDGCKFWDIKVSDLEEPYQCNPGKILYSDPNKQEVGDELWVLRHKNRFHG